MQFETSHDRYEETPRAKALWFQSLSLSERMDLLCAFTDLVVENNPDVLLHKPHAQPVAGRILVVSRP